MLPHLSSRLTSRLWISWLHRPSWRSLLIWRLSSSSCLEQSSWTRRGWEQQIERWVSFGNCIGSRSNWDQQSYPNEQSGTSQQCCYRHWQHEDISSYRVGIELYTHTFVNFSLRHLSRLPIDIYHWHPHHHQKGRGNSWSLPIIPCRLNPKVDL